MACSLFILLSILRHYDDADGRRGLAVRVSGGSHAGKEGVRDWRRLRANCGFVEICRDGQLERVFFQVRFGAGAGPGQGAGRLGTGD